MPDITVSNSIDTFMQSADQAEMRTRLSLGDSATKNTGTTAGTVAAGNDSRITGALQTSGGTMTGKLTAAADATNAKLNIGGRVASGSPTTLVDGDLWISNQGALSYRDSSTPFNKAVASLNLKQIFNQPQTISGTFNSDIALTVSNTGTREAVVISNTAAATSDAVVITNLGSGNSLVVNDETTPDSTRFAIANNGKVGIGVTPDASVALSVDTTGIKFGDNTTQTTAGLTGTVQEANGGTGETTYTNGQLLIGNAAGGLTKATLSPGTNVTITNGDGAITINATGGGSGTVTSVTAGTGLTGGTITSTGTIAADFGATTGKVTEGGTTVLKTGDTMTGKLTLPAVTAASAPLNLGFANVDPTTSANGDVWIRNNLIKYKGSSATVNTVAATAEPNNFTTNQAVTPTGTTTPVALAITQNAGNPNGALTVDLPNTSSTAAAVRITNLGAGPSLLVEDSNPDTTPFTVSASGRVGIGAAPDAAVALSVDTSGIKFGDNTTQTTAFTGTASNVTGTVAIANGGTGQTDRQAAMDALAGATTSGQYLRGNGTDVVMSAIQAADVPTLNQNTTGTAANVTGTVAIANGGTGQTTPNAAVNALLPSQSGNSGKVLSTDGTNTSWITAAASGVSSISAGTTGLTPATASTGAVTLAGTLNIANGGTGSTNAANAINALVPAQAGNSGKVLTTNGSVVSWGAAGGSGITALTGDVTASGSGSVSATVQKIQSRTVASTAPSAGQVLAWNDTTSQWEPTSAGGAVSYDVLRVLIATPGYGTYVVPSGYKYADIYACSGGGGGGSGMNTSGNASGGGGGSHGVFCYREKVYVENTQLSYTIGPGGVGGTQDLLTGIANPGTAGGGTVVQFGFPPPGGSASAVIADCGYYVNSGALNNSGGSAASPSGASGGFINFSQAWLQNTQFGGASTSATAGSQAANSTLYTQTTYVSSGGGGGGVSSVIAPNTFDGGNILDNNYVLYGSATPLNYAGITGSSSTIDATSVSGNPTLNIFWGGAGGAGADPSTAISSGAVFRAGNGANGAFGCGGGGGGSMFDLSGNFSTYTGGNGGNGGDGFILMYLYK